jgi:hypothetical protein
MIGRVEETSASFEAQSARRLYPTGGEGGDILTYPATRMKRAILVLFRLDAKCVPLIGTAKSRWRAAPKTV